MPFVLLFVCEVILRLSHYGDNLDDLFLTTADGKYYYINKDITRRYFNRGQATTGNAEFFKRNKDTRTIRFFVIGESAALGFPYPDNIAFSRMLKYTLKEAFPGKDIEVINLSFSAINSYTFYDIGKQLPNYSPDAILIYGGHNEYYGALGVASTSNWGNNPRLVRAMIQLKRLRLYQLIESSIYAFKNNPPDQPNEVFMQKIVRDQQIEYNGDTYRKGIRQFESNMQVLLHILEKESIPVFLSTVSTNIKDLKPFKSCSNTTSASFYFDKGKQQYIQEDYKNALQSFLKAQQYDCLRFRAPEEINLLIRHFAKTYHNITLVDCEKIFSEQSENEITGNELLLEHVHPNIKGHKEIAHAFFDEIISANLIGKPTPVQTDAILETYPVLEFDSLAGLYAYNKLIQGFPFYQETENTTISTDVEKLAFDYTIRKNWYKSIEQLYQYAVAEKDYTMALDILRVRMIDNSYDPAFYFPAGEICTLMGDYPWAIRYYEEGFALNPTFGIAKAIITTSLRNDEPEKAIDYIDYAIEHNQTGIRFQDLKPYIESIIRLKKELPANDNPAHQQAIRSKIAATYEFMGNKEVADYYMQ